MSPLEVLNNYRDKPLADCDGQSPDIQFLPGLSNSEIEDLIATLPIPMPIEIQELLKVCSGIDGLVHEIRFGGDPDVHWIDVMPDGRPGWLICDMRNAGPGYGFSWGRFG